MPSSVSLTTTTAGIWSFAVDAGGSGTSIQYRRALMHLRICAACGAFSIIVARAFLQAHFLFYFKPNSLALERSLVYTIRAGWSSLVARKAHNLEVVGSTPTPATA